MSMFSTTSANSLPSAPSVWMTTASTPAIGPRPKAITNIRAKTSCGTVRQSSQKRRTAKRSQRPGADVGGGQEAEEEGADRAQQRADIGHQQGLAEQPEPARQAPVPFGWIGPDPARRSRDGTAGRCSSVKLPMLSKTRRRRPRPTPTTSSDRRHDAGDTSSECQRRVRGPPRRRRQQRPQLRLRQMDDRRASRQRRRGSDQLFCLRSESMNLISSTTPS